MAQPRYHNVISSAEYARLNGISERTARRRLANNVNAVKTGRGYKVAVPSTVYARQKGISPTAARKSGTRSADPIRDIIAEIPGTSRMKLLQTLSALLPGDVNLDQLRHGISKMTPQQRALAAELNTYDDYTFAMEGDEFYDDEGDNLLWYH